MGKHLGVVLLVLLSIHTATFADAIHDACRKGDTEAAMKLVNANPAAAKAREASTGYTPLHIAAIEGNAQLAQFLINKGVEINATADAISWKRVTPLHVAINNKREAVALLLLARGADVNASEDVADDAFSRGVTPIYLASKTGNLKLVRRLIELKADVKAVREDNGETPLHSVMQTYKDDKDKGDGRVRGIVAALLAAGADIEAKTKDDATPLLYAAYFGHTGVVQQLVNAGADLTARNKKGDTALKIATDRGHIALAKWLLDKGAKE
jgi:ankyrin repeat protein